MRQLKERKKTEGERERCVCVCLCEDVGQGLRERKIIVCENKWWRERSKRRMTSEME